MIGPSHHREIKTLITTSVEGIEQGTQLADQAGEMMADIVAQVGRVAGLINEMSIANSEQTRGIDEVGAAMSNLDHMTQQNASLVEQAAAASESLREQSASLLQSVHVFRLDTHSAPPDTSRSPQAMSV